MESLKLTTLFQIIKYCDYDDLEKINNFVEQQMEKQEMVACINNFIDNFIKNTLNSKVNKLINNISSIYFERNYYEFNFDMCDVEINVLVERPDYTLFSNKIYLMFNNKNNRNIVCVGILYPNPNPEYNINILQKHEYVMNCEKKEILIANEIDNIIFVNDYKKKIIPFYNKIAQLMNAEILEVELFFNYVLAKLTKYDKFVQK